MPFKKELSDTIFDGDGSSKIQYLHISILFYLSQLCEDGPWAIKELQSLYELVGLVVIQ